MKQEKTLELVERAIAGDEEALSELCEAKVKKILYTAAGILGNLHDGEEVMQEVLIKIFQNVGKLREPKYFDLWLYRVILNECNDQRKIRMLTDKDISISEEQFQNIPEERIEFLPPEFLESDEKRSLLLDVVENLRPHYRTVVLLHYFDGLTYQQIADVMGVTVQSVNNNLRRARKKIREELGKSVHTKFDSVFAAAPVPVLTSAMELQAEQMISRQNAEQFVSAARKNYHNPDAAKATRGHATQKTKHMLAAKALAGAAAAVLVVFALAAGAIADPPTPSPLSSSVTESPSAPQPLGEDSVMEEGLEINEPISPMAGTVPQSEPAIHGEAAAGRPDVRGGLALKDADGNIVEGAQEYLSGVAVKLLDQTGAVFGETVTDSEGNFSFSAENAAEGYAIQVETTGTPLAPASENPQGIQPLGADAEGGAAVLYLNKTSVSKVTIDFFGGECECGHVNPKKAVALPTDRLDEPQSWEVWNEAGEVVARGESGETMTEGFQNLPEGKYALEWKIGDIAGNTGIARREFRIVHGPVDPQLYG